MSDHTNQTLNKAMSVEEMWSLTNKEDKNWGIEGYEIHKKHFDPKREIKLREEYKLNEDVWARKKHYPKPQVKEDKNGKPIIVKRPNYLDEVFKWANSFYDKEKGERIYEEIKDKNYKKVEKKVEVVKRAPRVTYTELLIKYEKKKYEPNKDKDLTNILDKIKKHEQDKKKSISDILKEKYGGKARKGQPMCDRVTITSEAVYVGEQIPFYNTGPLKGGQMYEDASGGPLKELVGEENKKARKWKKNKVLFFPRKFFVSAWTKAPGWRYPDKLPKDEKFDYEAVKNANKEKIETVVTKLKEKKIRTDVDVPISWYNTNYYHKGWTLIHENVKKEQQYDEWKKLNPPKYPGPQQYWKRLPVKYRAGKAKPIPTKYEPEEGKDKIYYLDEKFTGMNYYKPMKGHIF